MSNVPVVAMCWCLKSSRLPLTNILKTFVVLHMYFVKDFLTLSFPEYQGNRPSLSLLLSSLLVLSISSMHSPQGVRSQKIVLNVAISTISNSFEILNVLKTFYSFSSMLNDLWTTVSMSFPIDTLINSYVWNALTTLERPSQVTDLSAMYIPAKSNSHLFLWTINSMTSESYLITSLVYSVYSDVCI